MKPPEPKRYKTVKEAEAALKEARKFLAQANSANNRPMIQLWYTATQSINEQIIALKNQK